MNARYVIATSAKVELQGVDEDILEKVGAEGYFTREKKRAKVDEESFFKQGEKPEASDISFRIWNATLLNADACWEQKKKVASARASDQKAIDKNLLKKIKEEPYLLEYLRSTFSLRKGDRPHEMKW